MPVISNEKGNRMQNDFDARAYQVYQDIVRLSARIYGQSEAVFIENEVHKPYTADEILIYERKYGITLPPEMKAMFKYFSYCNGPDLTIFTQYKNDKKGDIVFSLPTENADSWDYSLYIPMDSWQSDDNIEILKELREGYHIDIHETHGAVENTPIFHPKWFYLSCCIPDIASYLFLDFAPKKGGKMGQVILMECCGYHLNRVVSPSLLDFYEDFVIPSLENYE